MLVVEKPVDKVALIEAHRPRWRTFRLWLLFSAVLAALQGLLFLSLQAGNYWLVVPCVLLVAHFMHSQLMAFHDKCSPVEKRASTSSCL